MTGHKIITIGREFGSGGHEIGQKLADRLGIPLYDNRLVSMAADELGVKTEDAGRVDESSLNTFVTGYTVTPGMYTEFINAASYLPSFDTEVYRKQAEIIKRLAEKGPCVIVGRCADYVLKDRDDCINVFICADWEDRVKRIAEKYDISERKAADKIKKMDRERQHYYESHTGLEWGSIDSHHMLLNVSRLGMERAVDILEKIYR